MFLGCNSNQIEYLKAAKEKKYYVVGTDINKNALGIKYLDKYYQVGYENYEQLIDLGNKESFKPNDKVFTASSQFAYIGASAFAKKFNIPFLNPCAIDICLNKIKLYELLEKYGFDVPDWKIVNRQDQLRNIAKNWEVFYLKSDYGKSPNYCFRISKDVIPPLPKRHDRYFREFFLAQKEIIGTHFRVNWAKKRIFCFHKISDTIAIPFDFIDLNGKILEKINILIVKLGIQNHLVKFDIIHSGGKYYFLDIGLEPPMRLRLYLNYLGYEFEKIYFQHLVENRMNYPVPKDLPKNLIIKGKTVKCI